MLVKISRSEKDNQMKKTIKVNYSVPGRGAKTVSLSRIVKTLVPARGGITGKRVVLDISISHADNENAGHTPILRAAFNPQPFSPHKWQYGVARGNAGIRFGIGATPARLINFIKAMVEAGTFSAHTCRDYMEWASRKTPVLSIRVI